MNQTVIALDGAQEHAVFVTEDLQQAMKSAGAVQGLAIIALIERAAALERDIAVLRSAIIEDTKEA